MVFYCIILRMHCLIKKVAWFKFEMRAFIYCGGVSSIDISGYRMMQLTSMCHCEVLHYTSSWIDPNNYSVVTLTNMNIVIYRI